MEYLRLVFAIAGPKLSTQFILTLTVLCSPDLSLSVKPSSGDLTQRSLALVACQRLVLDLDLDPGSWWFLKQARDLL